EGLAAALRCAPHRLARARSRLGDAGPQRSVKGLMTMAFESLDFVYHPSRDVKRDIAYFTDVLGGRLRFAVEGMGARVAAIELARRGAQPTLVARSEARAADAVSQIQAAAGGATVDVLTADLASQASVRQLAVDAQARYPRIQVLINNAGAIYASRQLSPD